MVSWAFWTFWKNMWAGGLNDWRALFEKIINISQRIKESGSWLINGGLRWLERGGWIPRHRDIRSVQRTRCLGGCSVVNRTHNVNAVASIDSLSAGVFFGDRTSSHLIIYFVLFIYRKWYQTIEITKVLSINSQNYIIWKSSSIDSSCCPSSVDLKLSTISLVCDSPWLNHTRLMLCCLLTNNSCRLALQHLILGIDHRERFRFWLLSYWLNGIPSDWIHWKFLRNLSKLFASPVFDHVWLQRVVESDCWLFGWLYLWCGLTFIRVLVDSIGKEGPYIALSDWVGHRLSPIVLDLNVLGDKDRSCRANVGPFSSLLFLQVNQRV